MLNVIICDDNQRDLFKVETIIDKFMKRNKYEYNKHIFKDYNESFMNIIKSKLPFKIYILDIETPSRSGIDVARKIRKKDLESIIIFLTGHDELGRVILQNDLMFLSFVNKFDNIENRLSNILYKAINIIKYKKIIKIEEGNNTYIIDINDIIYFFYFTFSRKTTIKTDYTEYCVRKSLLDICDLLDDRFIRTHRACIVNKNRISRIDKVNKIIYFDNGYSTDLLSDKYKKEMNI